MQRLRDRRRNDSVGVYSVEVSESALRFLVSRGLLDPQESTRPAAVGRALERALTDWANGGAPWPSLTRPDVELAFAT